MIGVVELAREVFAMPVRKGVPDRRITGLVDNVQAPRYAVPVGLALYGARQLIGGKSFGGVGLNGFLTPIKRWLQDFF
jgi:cell division ATPase FtsA